MADQGTDHAADAAADYIPLAVETLLGDLRDFILDRLRRDHSAVPWQMRPEADQRALVQATENAVRMTLHRAVALIGAGGAAAARGSVVKLAARDGLQVVVSVAASDPQRHALMDAIGSLCLLVLADADAHMGERAPVKTRPDQGDILEP